MITTSNTVVLKFPSGIDNRNREYELSEGSARILNNMDVTRFGGIRSRAGIRLSIAGDVHSLYAPPYHPFMLLVKDSSLCCLDKQGNLTTLTTVADRVTYALLNDSIFWSDGISTGQVLANGTLGLWGLAVPPTPVIVATTDGSLVAGTYQVAMTAVHSATGLESGAKEPASVDIVDNGAIIVTTPTAAATFQFCLYLTSVFGEQGELRQVAVVPPSTTITIRAPTFGRPLVSLWAVSPYPAQYLVSYRGRLWGGIGTTVWFTSEQSPHWLFPSSGFFQFESPITMLGTAEDGIYVGLYDKVYFLQGINTQDMTQRLVSHDGALAASELPITAFSNIEPIAKQCCWWDRSGFFCIGKAGGIIVKPTQDRYAAGEATTGVSCYREFEGIKQVVSLLNSTWVNAAMQATDTPIST